MGFKFTKKLCFKRIIKRVLWNFLALFSLLVFADKSIVAQDDFVDIRTRIPSIVIDMRYASTNNFTGKKIYDTAACFLRANVADRLARVQKRLSKKGYGLKIWDAYRPKSAQKILWKATPKKLRRYVANPKKGSKHSRGAAVDITLVDSLGNECTMPTGFDDFSIKARTHNMNHSKEAIMHREILHQAMNREGFLSIRGEWWHFNDPDWRSYPLSDIPLSQLAAQNN